MKLSAFTVSQLEQAINRLIALDPDTAGRVSAVDGHTISLRLFNPDSGFFLTSCDGRLIISLESDQDPVATLTGSTTDFTRSGFAGLCGKPLPEKQIEITGNQTVGRAFLDILGKLSIDWEDQLSNITGDVIAHQAGRITRRVARDTNSLYDTLHSNLSEYLQEELRALPTRIEIDNLFTSIADLEKRVRAAEQRFHQSGKAS